MKNYNVLNELVPITQELHRAIFDKGYEQGRKDILEQKEKTGHWVWDEKSRVYRCSCCNRFPWRVKFEKYDEIFTDLTRTYAYKFCPNCGVTMFEPQESEDKNADSN